ncbi:MAG TPA: DNA primase [Solirubrobacteraceae bacterium]|nr:DNA primase [Solirubrobacteraceae bacterium]
MTRYTPDSKDRVREAVDMLTLVSARTELRRAAVNSYFGLCPFHDERTPSFHVLPDDKRYHCFGCQASGDAFSFVMETEGVSFVGALETLADRFGVQLETEDEDPAAAARRQRRERLYELLGRATTYYARYLWEAKEAAGARTYLIGRGLAEETLREFRVGYAPSAWDRILLASRRAGFSDEELLAVGLAQRSRSRPGSIFDRFRERIMFPLADARGRVLGFGARAMRENQPPKYLNTSESELFHKGNQLFGIDLARAPAAKAGRVLLVEGYTDVLALHQAGLKSAVGIMGTALTEEQLGALEGVARVLELCLDADGAGQEAMLRAARLASGRNLELRVVALPEGSDPADLVRQEGVEALRARVERSVPFVVFQVQRILDRADTSGAEGRDRAFGELRPVLAVVPQSSLRDELVRRVAGRLELAERRLEALLAEAPAGAASQANGVETVVAARLDHGARAERTFLVLCVAIPDAGQAALATIDPDEHLTSEVLRSAARHLTGRLERPLADISGDEELARVVSDLMARAASYPDAGPDRLEHARLILELARLDRAIRRARGEASADVSALAREREGVLKAVRAVVGRLEEVV